MLGSQNNYTNMCKVQSDHQKWVSDKINTTSIQKKKKKDTRTSSWKVEVKFGEELMCL